MLSMKTVCALEFEEQRWECQAVDWTNMPWTHTGDKSDTSVHSLFCAVVILKGMSKQLIYPLFRIRVLKKNVDLW